MDARSSQSKVADIGDAIAALSLDEARGLTQHLQSRLGMFIPSIVVNPSGAHGCCGDEGSGQSNPDCQRKPIVAGYQSIWGAGRGAILNSNGNAGAGVVHNKQEREPAEQGKETGLYLELPWYLKLTSGYEDNLRKPELSELEEVKNLVESVICTLDSGAVEIMEIVERLQKTLGKDTAATVKAEIEALLDLSNQMYFQAERTTPVMHILRRRYAGDSGLNSLASSSSLGSSSES